MKLMIKCILLFCTISLVAEQKAQELPAPTAQSKQLFDVFLSAFLPQGYSNTEQLLDYFNKKVIPRLEKDHFIFTAFDNDRIVGFSIFEKWEVHSYYLAEMAILPKYQHQGIGKQLVFSIFDKDQETEKIFLITEKGNKGAQSFYEKIGFKHSYFKHPDYPENFIGYEFYR